MKLYKFTASAIKPEDSNKGRVPLPTSETHEGDNEAQALETFKEELHRYCIPLDAVTIEAKELDPAAMLGAAKAVDPQKLATAFCVVLHEWLTPRQLQEVVKRNLVEGVNGQGQAVCHTHDYCDANMAMDAAFDRTLGFPASVQFHETAASLEPLMTDLWNAAWALAKAWNFTPPNAPKFEDLMTWQQEFGADFDVPEIIRQLCRLGVLVDTSWHNDICPSFALNDGNDGQLLGLWCDHPATKEREMPEWPRFRVCDGPSVDPEHTKDHLATDDVMAALAEFFKHCPAFDLAPVLERMTEKARLYGSAYHVMAMQFNTLDDVNEASTKAIEEGKRLAAAARAIETPQIALKTT